MTLPNPANALLLDFDPSLQAQSWQASQTHYSSARWRAYINHLCLYGALPWLAELGFNPEEVYSVEQSHWAIWGLVGGSALSLDDGSRLVLLPSEAADMDELRIPQEWIDSPRWAADYYVGVRVNPDGEQCVWGYATHAQIKQQSRYDLSDRTYSLAGGAVSDLATLSVIRALCPEEPTRLDIPPLPELPRSQAEKTMQRLSQVASPALRLEVSFPLWAALMENDGWRSRLYDLRHIRQPERSSPGVVLSRWLRQVESGPSGWLAQGWQTLETLLPAKTAVSMALRSTELATAYGGKRLTLETDNGTASVLLVVGVDGETDGRVSVRVQLRPDAGAMPDRIELSLLSPSGTVVQAVQSRAIDDYIQLKRFRLPTGYPFTIQVRLGPQTVLEPFTT